MNQLNQFQPEQARVRRAYRALYWLAFFAVMGIILWMAVWAAYGATPLRAPKDQPSGQVMVKQSLPPLPPTNQSAQPSIMVAPTPQAPILSGWKMPQTNAVFIALYIAGSNDPQFRWCNVCGRVNGDGSVTWFAGSKTNRYFKIEGWTMKDLGWK